MLWMCQLEAVKMTRKNAEAKPFEAGGDGQLEYFARRSDAALFALGSSTKKRPHNLTLGTGLSCRRNSPSDSHHLFTGPHHELCCTSGVMWLRLHFNQ